MFPISSSLSFSLYPRSFFILHPYFFIPSPYFPPPALLLSGIGGTTCPTDTCPGPNTCCEADLLPPLSGTRRKLSRKTGGFLLKGRPETLVHSAFYPRLPLVKVVQSASPKLSVPCVFYLILCRALSFFFFFFYAAWLSQFSQSALSKLWVHSGIIISSLSVKQFSQSVKSSASRLFIPFSI